MLGAVGVGARAHARLMSTASVRTRDDYLQGLIVRHGVGARVNVGVRF